MKKTLVVAATLPLLLFLSQHQARAAAHRTFSNLAYQATHNGFYDKITLKGGSGVIWAPNGFTHVSLYYMDRYVLGDFDGDGRRDAAVIIGESHGIGDEVMLAFLIHDGRNFVHKQSIHLGHSAIVNSLKQRDGEVIIDMFIHQRGDCQAGPTKRVIARYDFLNPPSDEVAFPRPIYE